MLSRVWQRRALHHYVCVLDFEANCGGRVLPEIIEFPSVLLRLPKDQAQAADDGFQLVDKFESFVRPSFPLTKFCTRLTSIRQDQVARAQPFPQVFSAHQTWLKSHVGDYEETMFITCGNGDLGTMLPRQLELSNLAPNLMPREYSRWINLQQVFAQYHTSHTGVGLRNMLRQLELEMDGVQHRGIWDCINTAKIVHLLHRRFGETFTRATNHN